MHNIPVCCRMCQIPSSLHESSRASVDQLDGKAMIKDDVLVLYRNKQLCPLHIQDGE